MATRARRSWRSLNRHIERTSAPGERPGALVSRGSFQGIAPTGLLTGLALIRILEPREHDPAGGLV
jgi:hypothetical protein